MWKLLNRLFGWSDKQTPGKAGPAGPPGIEDQAREALFGHLLKGMDCWCFLGLEDNNDPPPGLVAQLSRTGFKVRAISDSTHDRTRDNCVVDRKTGERGCQFIIKRLTRTGEGQFTASVVCYSDCETSHCSNYHLERSNNQWVVSREGREWVS
jgi:hypothetical protein